MDNMNDAFKALAKEVETEEKDRATRRAGGGGNNFNYETIKWSGLTTGEMKVVRALGGVPNSGDSPFTARTVRHSSIVNDKGKKMRVILPMKDVDPSYILWKVIDRVMDVDWVDKKKVYSVEKTHPEIFNIVAHNGYPAGSPQNKYDKGWAGRDYFVFNCLDRDPEVYAWSKANKHSVLLSKQVNASQGQDGKLIEYAEEGVPAYGFISILAMNIFKHYGDWRNYDLGVTRTGLMETPMRVINASKYIEEVPEQLQPLVVNGPLTEEEKSWAQYDLDKLFGVTSYTKLWNNLKLTFAKIDASLGTHFMDELKSLADAEVAERAAKGNNKEDGDDPDEVPSGKVEETVEVRSKSVEKREAAQQDLPPAFHQLTDEEKKLILGGKPTTGAKWELVYDPKTSGSKKYACSNCGTVVPEEFMTCPVCGLKW